LSAVGGTLGLVVGWGGVRFVQTLPEGSLARLQPGQLAGGVLAVAPAASLPAAVLLGLAPPLPASRAARRDCTKATSGTPPRSRCRLLGAVVVVEVALALVMLVGAGLMTRSFAQLMQVSPGFEPRNLLAVQIYLPQAKYKNALERTRFYKDAIHRVAA